MSRDALAEVLWPAGAPPSWETSLKALVSKLRPFTTGLAPRGSPAPAIHGQYGCYQLELPKGAWIDVEAAWAALDEAEGALRRGCPQVAWGSFNVAVAVARAAAAQDRKSTRLNSSHLDTSRMPSSA